MKRELRQQIMKRTVRDLPNLIPFMIGAAVGALMNRRDARRLADRVRNDLRRKSRSPGTVLPELPRWNSPVRTRQKGEWLAQGSGPKSPSHSLEPPLQAGTGARATTQALRLPGRRWRGTASGRAGSVTFTRTAVGDVAAQQHERPRIRLVRAPGAAPRPPPAPRASPSASRGGSGHRRRRGRPPRPGCARSRTSSRPRMPAARTGDQAAEHRQGAERQEHQRAGDADPRRR